MILMSFKCIDIGVSGDACQCNDFSGTNISSWNTSNYTTEWSGFGYFPSFPATSPYVTAVGATSGPESGKPEIASQSQLGDVITTGGGFSTYFPQPIWQNTAVNDYFESLTNETTPASGFNPLGRAYPDISLIGVNYQIVVGGVVSSVYGTSCSSPAFAAFISLINAARYAKELPTVGFINPTLYATTSESYYNNVTSGINNCCAYSGPLYVERTKCCGAGFYSGPGWDPVTGWGSIDYTNLELMFQLDPDNTNDDVTDDTTDTSSNSKASGLTFAGKVGIAVSIGIVGIALITTAVLFLLIKFKYIKWSSKEENLTSPLI
jgi:subtilase family serine protease